VQGDATRMDSRKPFFFINQFSFSDFKFAAPGESGVCYAVKDAVRFGFGCSARKKKTRSESPRPSFGFGEAQPVK
jgi:hypothetical protein